jgi:hypothetical protein
MKIQIKFSDIGYMVSTISEETSLPTSYVVPEHKLTHLWRWFDDPSKVALVGITLTNGVFQFMDEVEIIEVPGIHIPLLISADEVHTNGIVCSALAVHIPNQSSQYIPYWDCIRRGSIRLGEDIISLQQVWDQEQAAYKDPYSDLHISGEGPAVAKALLAIYNLKPPKT